LLNVVALTLEDGSTLQDQTVHPVAPVEGIEEEEVVDGEELADTGANGVGNLVGAALVAMLAGGLMVTFGRRRREE
jgi:LPXTG-motif cell wall-anchored protein